MFPVTSISVFLTISKLLYSQAFILAMEQKLVAINCVDFLLK